MIVDIFSSFDPSNSETFHLSRILFWLITIIPLIILTSLFWLHPPQFLWSSFFVITNAHTQVTRTNGFNLGGLTLILSPTLYTLIVINLTGIIPYIIRLSSHLLFTVTFGIPLWLALILSGFSKNPKTATANLLPRGAPTWLNPALILIETIRILVRPITLTVRLAANISAGHIVLGLIGLYCAASIETISSTTIVLILLQIGYILFEFGICFIQAYIFFLLLSLYSDEHPL